jgi:hypothetical protein
MKKKSSAWPSTRQGLLVFAACVTLLASEVCRSDPLPTGSKLGTVQFDVILELNSPLVHTDVALFARYWVAPDHYTIAVVWAEPHARDLNFAMYPVTLTIYSNDQQFRLSSQTDAWANATYAKPVGQRGVFRYMFNDYPVANARFGEAEALGARLYAGDLKDSGAGKGGDENAVVLSLGLDPARSTRSLDRIKPRSAEGCIQGLDLLNQAGDLVKSVDYEYTQVGNASLLKRARVLLPQTPLTVGFTGEGIRVKVGEETCTYNEFQMAYHEGTREATVMYEPVEIGRRRASLPASVSVRNPVSKDTLRSARLSNFKSVAFGAEEIPRTAQEFADFGPEISRCRQLAVKYWARSPSEVPADDKQSLQELQGYFKAANAPDSAPGEQLRRVNMLLQLDWMLGDTTQLARDFEEYLRMLESWGLKQMVLAGGRHIIETTVLWGYFAAADVLLSKWVDRSVTVCDKDSLLHFAYDESRTGRLWTVVKLMDRIIKQGGNSGEIQFEAHALRCICLQWLYAQMREPESLKRDVDVAQIGWVARSMAMESLLSAFKDALTKAKQSFERVSSPTERQKILMRRLEGLGERQPSGNQPAPPASGPGEAR